MFGVVAFLQANPGTETEVESILGALVDDVRSKEPDATVFKMFRHLKAPDTFVMMEEYKTAEAFEAHGVSPHFKAAFEQLGPMLGPNSGIHTLGLLK